MVNLDLVITRQGLFHYQWRLWERSSRVVAEGVARSRFGARRAGTRKAQAHLVTEDSAGWLYTRLRRSDETIGRGLGSREIVPRRVRRRFTEEALRRPVSVREPVVLVSVSPSGVVRVKGARKIVVR